MTKCIYKTFNIREVLSTWLIQTNGYLAPLRPVKVRMHSWFGKFMNDTATRISKF